MEDSLPPNFSIDNVHMSRNTTIDQVTNEYGKSSIRYFTDFDVTYSAHCPILVGVQSLYCCHETDYLTQRKSPKNVKWDDNKRMSFINHINMINL